MDCIKSFKKKLFNLQNVALGYMVRVVLEFEYHILLFVKLTIFNCINSTIK